MELLGGSLEKYKKGIYYYRISIKVNEKYTQKRYKIIADNDTEAKTKANAKYMQVKSGEIEPPKLTVEQYLEQWMTEYCKAKPLRQSTLTWYQNQIDLHIVPVIGQIQIGKLNALHIQRLINDSTSEDTTKKAVYSTLRAAFNRAVKWEMIKNNPVLMVDPPTVKDREYRLLTEDESKKFLMEARNSPIFAFYLTELVSGLRLNEIAGIRLEDVDYETKIIQIKQQLISGGGNVQFGPVKTKKSKREIPLPDILATEYQKLRNQQKKGKSVAQRMEKLAGSPEGTLWEEYGLVFTQDNGRPLDTKNISKRKFKKLLENIGLKDEKDKIRFHDLRHSVATILLELGYSIKQVSELLGHSSVKVTERYLHMNVEFQRSAVDDLANRFSKQE